MAQQQQTQPHHEALMHTKPYGRVVLYARVAGTSYPALSLVHQIQVCRFWAQEHGMIIDEEFMDGYNTNNLGRPTLKDLFGHLKTHPVDYVVCATATALSQDETLCLEAVRRTQHSGAQVAVASQNTVLHIDDGESAPTEAAAIHKGQLV